MIQLVLDEPHHGRAAVIEKHHREYEKDL